jgi:hypothetical protein
VLEWRGDAGVALAPLFPPRGERAEVILSRADGGEGEVLRLTPWAACARIHCAPVFGESDVLGAAALAVAAARVGTGRVRDVLILGLARSRGYAVVLTAP